MNLDSDLRQYIEARKQFYDQLEVAGAASTASSMTSRPDPQPSTTLHGWKACTRRSARSSPASFVRRTLRQPAPREEDGPFRR